MAMLLSIPKSPHKNINPKSTDNIYNKNRWQRPPHHHQVGGGNRSPPTTEPPWYEREQQEIGCQTDMRTETSKTANANWPQGPFEYRNYIWKGFCHFQKWLSAGVHGEVWGSWCHRALVNSWNWSFTKGVTIRINLGVESKLSTRSIIKKKEREYQNKNEEGSKA